MCKSVAIACLIFLYLLQEFLSDFPSHEGYNTRGLRKFWRIWSKRKFLEMSMELEISSKYECVCFSLSISVLEVSLMTKKNKRYQFTVVNIHTSETRNWQLLLILDTQSPKHGIRFNENQFKALYTANCVPWALQCLFIETVHSEKLL